MIEAPIYFQSKGAEEYRFLSNFWLSPIVIGYSYATVEHFYQAQKTLITAEFEAIRTAATPREAKNLGMTVRLRSDWEERGADGLLFKDKIMLDGLRAKFEQHANLRAQLIATRNRHLIEYAPWGDRYWGVDKNYQGRNMLGTLLMLVRATHGRDMS